MFKHLMKKIAEPVAAVDLRGGITCDLQMIDEWEDEGEVMTTYEIHPYVNGKQVGYMDFIVHNFTDNVEENYIEVISIQIDEEYRGFGISTEVYKKFSELYRQQYDGYPLERLFQNPVAEYSFRKAVSNGYVDSVLLDNSRIKRDYKTEDKQYQWNELNEKLPENVKGAKVRVGKYMPKVTNKIDLRKMAKTVLADFRKIANTVIVDLRNLTFQNEMSTGEYSGTTSEEIDALIDGESVGYLSYTVDAENQILTIDLFEVEDEYQNLGIGTALYKEFGKLYESKYNGWPVARYFVNPVAEYAFRKAVSLGWVSENAITEDQIKRSYDDSERELAKDLRKKLPENLRGPETWANRRDLRKIVTAAAPADLRGGVTTNVTTTNIEEDDDEEYYYYGATYQISAMANGEEIGFLRFVETRTREEGIDDHFLYLAKIEVENKYREHGIGTMLYKAFGEIYGQKFAGWEVERHFENPIAEYAFKRAIELGYVPAEAFTEKRTTRDYNSEQQKLWTEKLEPKLKSAASRVDLRKVTKAMIDKVSAILDLRRSNQPKPDNFIDMTQKEFAPNVLDLRTKALPPNVTDLRDINKLQFDTLDDYYTERGMQTGANLRDLRKTIGASAIKELRKLKKFVREAEAKQFYHGSPLPRALEILNAGSINSMNTQGDGAQNEQNVSLQADAVYVTTKKGVAKTYALAHNTAEWGIIFEMTLDTANSPLVIDEDTFYWGEGLDSTENRETFTKMFGGDKKKASDFVKSIVDSGFFDGLKGYDPYDDEEFDMLVEDYVAQDSEGYYYMDLSSLQFGNVSAANEIIKKIPFEDQTKANDTTFAYAGDISLSTVNTFYLVNSNEEFALGSADEVIAKYNELVGNQE